MPTSAISLGRDCTLDIIHPEKGPLRFAIRTGFKAEPLTDEIVSKGMDGFNRYAYAPNGHRLSFEFDRADSLIEDHFLDVEERYFNGEVIPDASITQTVKEKDGSISQYRYTGVALKLDSSGDWKGNDKVALAVSGMASRKRKVV